MFKDTSDLRDNEIKLVLNHTCEARKEISWVPTYYFDICIHDGTVIGKCDLRLGYNEKTYIGGNIGYNIYEPYRGHHYAAKACRLLFRQARKHDMNYLIITCQPTNIASARTCELAGGVHIETTDIPESNEMYAEGKRQVSIYRFDLNKLVHEDSYYERYFVENFVRKQRQERLLHELTDKRKRYAGLDRFCHKAEDILDLNKVLISGQNLEKEPVYADFIDFHDQFCYLMSPSENFDRLQMPLRDALDLLYYNLDASVIVGSDFAIVTTEIEKGGQMTYLLTNKR